MEMLITAIVVVYNKRIEDSLTCRNILKFSNEYNIKICVVDNSTQSNDNLTFCEKKGIQYISMNGNAGLSKAYNMAIEKNRLSDVFVLFDDDTNVTKSYFDVLKKDLSSFPDVDIFAPIIRGQDGVIYSPNESNFLKNKLVLNKSLEVSKEKFNAIASCLAIRSRIFDGYRFNEILFLDQVDQNFFDEQRKLGSSFRKMNVEILQNFYQRVDSLKPQAGWARLQLRIVDILRHARIQGGIKNIIIGYIKCCGLGIQIGKKSKSILIPFKAFVLTNFALLTKK